MGDSLHQVHSGPGHAADGPVPVVPDPHVQISGVEVLEILVEGHKVLDLDRDGGQLRLAGLHRLDPRALRRHFSRFLVKTFMGNPLGRRPSQQLPLLNVGELWGTMGLISHLRKQSTQPAAAPVCCACGDSFCGG